MMVNGTSPQNPETEKVSGFWGSFLSRLLCRNQGDVCRAFMER